MSRNATRQVERSGFALAFHTALLSAELGTEEFARKIDRPLRTVYRWRNGESEPDAANFALILHALGLSADVFFPPEEQAA